MNLMALYDETVEALGKEAKEAPGWVLLSIACNLLPLERLLPWVQQSAGFLGIELCKDPHTVAALIAVTLFFIGDILDTFFFPRHGEDKRRVKLLRASLLTLAAWALFLLFLGTYLASALFAGAVLILFVGFSEHTAGVKKSTGCELLVRVTGLKKRLKRAKTDAAVKLGLPDGYYAVSKSLAQRAKTYLWLTMLQNELGKFVRSAVFPLILWALWFLTTREFAWSGLALLGAVFCLWLYTLLKALHMCRLYESAATLPGYQKEDLPQDIRVFLWNTGSVAQPKYAVVGSGRRETARQG